MSDFFSEIKNLPNLGIGLGLRRSLFEETLNNASSIDWLEIIPENYMGIGGKTRDILEEASFRFPLVSHGVNLSIGSTDDLNYDYLKNLKILLDRLNVPWWSDHLCFSSANSTYLQDLLPLPHTKEAVSHVVERIKRVQDYIGRPFLLENISAYMKLPNAEMEESEFISSVLEQADCGLLLDVNNVYVNSVNFNFDPREFLSKLPLERTVQIHIAGHRKKDAIIIDSHGAPIIEDVYDLLKWVVARVNIKAALLERDQNFPGDFNEINYELDRIRTIVLKEANYGTPIIA